jgi:hypothetical protein
MAHRRARSSIALAATSFALACVGFAAGAEATARQIHAGPAVGASWTSGPRGGVDGVVGLHGAWDFTDAWRLYANFQYGLGGGVDSQNTPRHELSLSTGVAYMIDVLSVLPWVGLGVNGTFVFTPTFTGFAPALEARGGVDYLVSRYFGLTFQISYGFVIWNRDAVGDLLTGLVGLRWTVDL